MNDKRQITNYLNTTGGHNQSLRRWAKYTHLPKFAGRVDPREEQSLPDVVELVTAGRTYIVNRLKTQQNT